MSPLYVSVIRTCLPFIPVMTLPRLASRPLLDTFPVRLYTAHLITPPHCILAPPRHILLLRPQAKQSAATMLKDILSSSAVATKRALANRAKAEAAEAARKEGGCLRSTHSMSVCVCLSVCQYVCMVVCPSVRPFVRLTVRPFVLL